MLTQNTWLKLGCFLAAAAVTLGAYAAHGLDKLCVELYPPSEAVSVAGHTVPLSFKRVQDFRTGAEYQMYHALGLICVGLIGTSRKPRMLQFAAWMFLVGIVCFSGSLYGITLTGMKALGMIAPIGGTAFILGWIALGMAACGCSAVCPTPPTAGR